MSYIDVGKNGWFQSRSRGSGTKATHPTRITTSCTFSFSSFSRSVVQISPASRKRSKQQSQNIKVWVLGVKVKEHSL
jgi:hypothetical protein